MYWLIVNGAFFGVMPDGTGTNNEDDFYDAWCDVWEEEHQDFDFKEEDWL